jgi:integrase
MASLSTNASGNRRIMFKAPDGQRKTLYLGKAPVKQAQAILAHVERLVACGIDGSAPPEATAHWLAACSAELRSKLAALGLAPEAVKRDVVTLGGLVERFQARPAWKSLKPTTQLSSARAFRLFLQHFDPTTPIDQLTSAAAADFHGALRLSKAEGGMGQAISTGNVVTAIVATMFNYAVDAELLARNPFRKLPRGTRRGNNAMVSLPDSLKVLEALRTAEDRLVFGLGRWGGLRTISEQRGLVWSDVDWERGRLLVRSPKTERHSGRESRWLPLFPEIAKLLEERFDEAEPGDHVLPTYCRADKSKVTTMLASAIKRAGVEKWPRLWHSLRATRQSELTEIYPSHVVSKWLGNSEKIAERHYLMVSDEHFERATQKTTQTPPATPRHDATSERGEGEDTLDSRSVSPRD